MSLLDSTYFSRRSTTRWWNVSGWMFLQICIRMNQSPNQIFSMTRCISRLFEELARPRKIKDRTELKSFFLIFLSNFALLFYLEMIVMILKPKKMLVQPSTRRYQNHRKK